MNSNDMSTMNINICHNTLAAVAVMSVATVGGISIATGHDGLEIVLATITAIGSGTPFLNKWSAPPPTK